MKKIIVPSLLAVLLLPACGGSCCRKTCEPKRTEDMPCEQQYEPVHVKKQKRVSGPLSEKEVGWNEDDYQ